MRERYAKWVFITVGMALVFLLGFAPPVRANVSEAELTACREAYDTLVQGRAGAMVECVGNMPTTCRKFQACIDIWTWRCQVTLDAKIFGKSVDCQQLAVELFAQGPLIPKP